MRQHRLAFGRQGDNCKGVFARGSLHADQEFLVFALCIGDHRHSRTNPAHELGHFAGMTDAGFDDRHLGFTIEAKQHHRHADVVVVVLLGGNDARLAHKRAQDRGDHLRGGGFPVAACHTNYRHRKLTAPGAGESPERLLRIAHDDLRAACTRITLNHHDACAVSGRLRRVVVSVEALTLERHKDASLPHLSGIGAHRAQIGSGGVAERAHYDRRERMLERAHRPSVLSNHLRLQFFCARRACRSLKASRAVSKSSKGCRTPATS